MVGSSYPQPAPARHWSPGQEPGRAACLRWWRPSLRWSRRPRRRLRRV